MSLLAYICIVLVFVEFQSSSDGPGMSSAGGILRPQALQTCCDTPSLFGKDFLSSYFFFILRGGDGGDGLGSMLNSSGFAFRM